MFFIGYGNRRSILIFTLVFSFFIHFFAEFKMSRPFNAMQRLRREVIKYDYSQNISDRFVYAVVSDYEAKAMYFDTYFNLTIKSPVVGRIVEYCQWKQNTPNYFDQISIYNMYSKVWTRTQINSNHFFSLKFKNPKTLPLNKTTKYMMGFRLENGVELGGLMSVNNGFYMYNVNEKDITDFENSEAKNQDKFEYIGNDFFYYSIDGTLQKKYMKDLENKRNETIKTIMNYCTPGDIRVKFVVFSPPTFTYIGFLNNESKIVPNTYQNIRIGKITEGNVSLDSLLDTILEEQNDKSDFNETQSKSSFSFILSIFFFVFSIRASVETKSLTLILIGIINLLIRSLIWDKPILRFKLWFSVFIVFLPFYYLYIRRQIVQ